MPVQRRSGTLGPDDPLFSTVFLFFPDPDANPHLEAIIRSNGGGASRRCRNGHLRVHGVNSDFGRDGYVRCADCRRARQRERKARLTATRAGSARVLPKR
jgi:hypothetical protein